MRAWVSIIAVTMSLVLSAFCQNSPNPDKPLPKPIARISYNSVDLGAWNQQQGSPKLCFALFSDGYYRMSRLTTRGSTEKVQGTLSVDQLAAFKKLLAALRFQNGGAGLVQNSAESFVAEISRDDKTGRYFWLDPDHRKPLPSAALDVVKWLQNFKPQNAQAIDMPELTNPICPPASEKPVQPVASLIF